MLALAEMSVVAACVLQDRVLISANSRLTRRWPDGREEHTDNLLKLYQVGPYSVVGFVGNVGAASRVPEELFSVRGSAVSLIRRRRRPPKHWGWLARM
jgi:hypothetical protein